ncbi:MAG TPA: FAD-dependent oxidoreductase [Xanthomonadales bacterium]|nr:FAD-dependent oxidoreductase [Xanthomonadales bacterium]
MHTTDVVVIGGGITGLGVARDAAMRGLSVTLLERGGLGSGTSGYFQGILHSGARYAVIDPQSARECYSENQILRRIAKDTILDTGGLFLAFTDEEVTYSYSLISACKSLGIPTEELSPTEIIKKEPRINKELKRAFSVPDGHIDGTKTLELNKISAEKLGVKIYTNSTVTGFIKKNNQIEAVVLQDNSEIRAKYFINAAGIWAKDLGKLAGIDIPLVGYKGSMVVFEEQFTRTHLNRCRMPSDGDLLLPTGKEYILGTTSVRTDDIDTHVVEQWEIDKLLKEAEVMVPGISKSLIKRSYAGVRPIYSPSSEDIPARSESRSFKILDHKEDGIDNFISVVGGKFILHRLMAEKAVDILCKDLGVNKQCQTASIPLS